jgi:thiol-disulfide isomerase/thioredoxin
MNTKKLTITLLFLSVCFISNSQIFKVLGFNGTDTTNYGVAVTDTAGNILLPKYLPTPGEIRLVPNSSQYDDITKHLSLIKQAYNTKNTILLEGEKMFVNNNLDFEALYHSPNYRNYIEYWVGAYLLNTAGQEQFAENFSQSVNSVLARLIQKNKEDIASVLVMNLIQFMDQFGYGLAAAKIAEKYQNINFSQNKTASIANLIITSYNLVHNQQVAPAIIGLKETKYPNALIIFYSSDCSHCQTEIAYLQQNYNSLKSKGIRIITIASDENKAQYEEFTKAFVWSDKLCDFKGFSGQNFVNYGIISTPVIYQTNSNGKIIGAYAKFTEIKNENF